MKNVNPKPISVTSEDNESEKIVLKAARFSDAGNHEGALQILSNAHSQATHVVNARGVCQMRLGRNADALKTFRSFVMQSGCTWMKRELPVVYRTNFVTAILLSNLPNGVRDTLAEISEKDHPSVMRLQDAVNAWQKSLSWWQKLNWKLGVVPAVPLTIDFVPGQFIDSLPASPAPPRQNLNQPSQQVTNQLA
ncbi:MAG: hypothetical protein WAO83_25345 [Fuerstiella sp.]